MQVVLVEPGFRGHRSEFVSYGLGILRDAGISSVVATSQEAARSEEFRAIDYAPGRTEVQAILREENSIIGRMFDVRALLGEFRSHQLVFLNADEYLPALASNLSGRTSSRITGIILRPPSHRTAVGRAKRLLISHLERRGASFYDLSSPFAPPGSRPRVVDPSGLSSPRRPSRDSALLLGLAKWATLGDEPMVAVVGALDPRKNIDTLLDVAENGGVRVLLVGKPSSDDYEDHLAKRTSILPRDRIFTAFRRVSEAELDAVIDMADFLALLYANKIGSSGLLARSARLGTAVLAWGNETVCAATITHNLGTVLTSLDVGHILTVLKDPPARGGTHPRLGFGETMVAEARRSWSQLLRIPDEEATPGR